MTPPILRSAISAGMSPASSPAAPKVSVIGLVLLVLGVTQQYGGPQLHHSPLPTRLWMRGPSPMVPRYMMMALVAMAVAGMVELSML